jgi:uncharacterized membrane protein YfcA
VTLLEVLAVLAAGMAAGAINTLVGSGTLVTFPVLLAVGFSPVVANVSNTVGLVPGSISGAVGYRRELRGQGRRVLRYGVASAMGGLTGAILLLQLPSAAFDAIVPVFIVIALALILLQPALARRLAERRERSEHGVAATLAVYGSGVYGGYFGAAQGIMLLGILGLTTADEIQRVNALKNVLAGIVNLVAGVIFVIVADVAWDAAIVIAVGAIIGAQLAARYGRRLPATALRGLIVVVGIAAIVQLVA